MMVRMFVRGALPQKLNPEQIHEHPAYGEPRLPGLQNSPSTCSLSPWFTTDMIFDKAMESEQRLPSVLMYSNLLCASEVSS